MKELVLHWFSCIWSSIYIGFAYRGHSSTFQMSHNAGNIVRWTIFPVELMCVKVMLEQGCWTCGDLNDKHGTHRARFEIWNKSNRQHCFVRMCIDNWLSYWPSTHETIWLTWRAIHRSNFLSTCNFFCTILHVLTSTNLATKSLDMVSQTPSLATTKNMSSLSVEAR